MTRRGEPTAPTDGDDLAVRVREMVMAAPPLSDEQRVRIRAILSLRSDVPLSIDGLGEAASARTVPAHFQVTATAS